jgi:hypothetical protein
MVSCLSGLDPLPSKTEDLTMSVSVPVGVGETSIGSAYYLGVPNINLAEAVPIWAKYDTVYYTDTIPVDLSQIYDKSSVISYLAFKINIWNEYPAGCKVQMYFTDIANTTLYSFWDSNPLTIAKGDISFSGKVFHPTYKGSTATFDNVQIEQLRTVEKLIFHIKIGLNDTPIWSFQYFDNYKLTCQLGVRADFILNNL